MLFALGCTCGVVAGMQEPSSSLLSAAVQALRAAAALPSDAAAAAAAHAGPHPEAAAARGRWHARPAGGGLHIVRFKSYEMAGQHRAALTAALGGGAAGGWEWVERHNPAAAYPTDFGLLRLDEEAEASMKVGRGVTESVANGARQQGACRSSRLGRGSWQRGRWRCLQPTVGPLVAH